MGEGHPRRQDHASVARRVCRLDDVILLLLRFADRHSQQHERAPAGRRADAHRAAMQLGQRLGDGEAKSGTLMALGDVALDLLERTSELAQRVLRNADAGVRDGDARLSARSSARAR